MSRLERLVNLSAALLSSERSLSADQIRDRVPGYPDDKSSFRRQFERDKDALRDLGFPLVTITGSQSDAQYSVDPDSFYLRDPGLTPDELSALSMAAEVVRLNGLGDQRLTDVLWKFAAQRKSNEQGADRGKTSPPKEFDLDAELPGAQSLAPIFDAIARGATIEFSYRDEQRVVVPRSLSFENGRWYLSAFDTKRADDRSFRIDRIDGDVNVGEAPAQPIPQAQTRTSPSRAPWEMGTGEAIETLVLVDADHAPWAERHVGSDAVRDRHNDGSVTLALNVRSISALRSFVVGFLSGAEIVAPATMRENLVAWLRTRAEAGT